MFIIEKKHQHQSTFDVCERGLDGRVTVLKTLYVYFVQTTNSNGEPRYIIYDEDLCPIHSIYVYLNWGLKYLDISTIYRAVTPLRLLVAFCQAHHLKDFIIPELYCSDFIDFLYRNDHTLRSTAAAYFNDIKRFMCFIRHDDDPIMAHTSRITWMTGADGVNRPHYFEEYKYAPKRNPERDLICPAHNTIKEFYLLQNTMAEKLFRNGDQGDIAGCIIVILLFKMGRRIGEVLGLTIEDISSFVDSETGEVSHCIYLRNRIHDEIGQHAKNRDSPYDKKEYKNKEYIISYNSPRNRIKLEEDIFQLIKAYIETVHARAENEKPEMYETAIADIINPTQFAADWGLEKNHYLFLNSMGGKLKKGTWYKRILQYYRESNVALGYGKSPNHAFRHGIAFIMRHQMHKSTREIADFLGHKNEQSAEVYAKADFNTIAQLGHIVQLYIDHEIESFDNLEIDENKCPE